MIQDHRCFLCPGPAGSPAHVTAPGTWGTQHIAARTRLWQGGGDEAQRAPFCREEARTLLPSACRPRQTSKAACAGGGRGQNSPGGTWATGRSSSCFTFTRSNRIGTVTTVRPRGNPGPQRPLPSSHSPSRHKPCVKQKGNGLSR